MRFGRKKDGDQVDGPVGDEATTDAGASLPGDGPYDLSEVDYDEADESRVNLGSLVIKGRPGVELRLQVDEGSGSVAAALLVSTDGAVELRAFASPRNGGIWDDVRKSLRAEAARQGGTATEMDGPWGTELQLMVTGQDDKGRPISQPSRIAGITGPRWLLRATFFGKPAEDPDPDHILEQTLREVIVVRGDHAMAPGEFLPLILPASATKLA